MAGVGPWPGVGAGEEEKYAPPQAGERAGAGNFAGGPCFMGPRRPRNEHYIPFNSPQRADSNEGLPNPGGRLPGELPFFLVF